jgi:predicted adenine nucleotide alpha hydrolase (AANH) superfamily ATPase
LKKKLLLHICCAPCAILPIIRLHEEYDITGLFFNPNIHPYNEYQDRKKSVIELGLEFGIPIVEEDYSYLEFLKKTIENPEEKDRCRVCYEMRLFRLKETANQKGITLSTTSLLYSIYQKHDLIQSLALQIFEPNQFLAIDYRKEFLQGVFEAKSRNYYRQKYCGCIFSNFERYHESKKK